MVGLLFDGMRRDGFARKGQLRRVTRRWVAAGGMLDSCELKSMTWLRGLADGSYAPDGWCQPTCVLPELPELDQT